MFHSVFMSGWFCIIYLLLNTSPSPQTLFLHHAYFSDATTYHTTSSQFTSLNTVPLAFLITRPRSGSRLNHARNLVISVLILLSGDIQSNPGPVSSSTVLNVCTLNIRSLVNPRHYTALADLAESHNIHAFALTETWLHPTSAEIVDAIPHGFSFVSNPRPGPPTCTSSVVGGGTAFLIRDPSTLLSSPTTIFKSFEMSTITLKLAHSKLTVYNIYRPPSSSAKSRATSSFSQFLEDFQTLVSLASTSPHEFLITGDFNVHVDDLTDSCAIQFLSLLDQANLTQHVKFATHRQSHTLDLVITATDSTLSPSVTYSPISPSDHFPVIYSLNIMPRPSVPPSKHFTRSIHSINIQSFIRDIISSRLITHPPTNLTDLVDCFNSTLCALLNKHAPLKCKSLRLKPANQWFTPALNKLKLAKRHLERVWSRTHSAQDLGAFRTASNHFHSAIIKAKRDYNSTLISSSRTNPRQLWKTVNNILHRSAVSVLPSSNSLSSLSQSFATFFSDKIHKLHTTLLCDCTRSSPHFPPPVTPSKCSSFSPVTIEEVSKLLSQSPDTNCDLDPIPTSLLKKCTSVLLPTITKIINLSLSTGTFPDQFKNCSVHPHLKKSNLDKENLANYRPISHLSFLSKLTERVVKSRLTEYLSDNNLLNSHQSAYIKSHSTESALLSVHDHIIKAMSLQKVTALTLLDLSAAFDTIDHSILLERLSSWFGITSTALAWLKSYLQNRSFYVTIDNSKSSSYQLLYGVPQGSVLGPLLFILYTTPLSTLISQSSAQHQLFADDTQLFLSFSAADFSFNITHLEQTVSKVSDWMSANFLSLNPSKTEFLLIGLPQQLKKINNPKIHLPNGVVLSPVTSARNLGVIFDNNITFSQHISSVSKSCFYHIRDLRRIRNTIDRSTACTIATSLVHSKVDYCNSLFLNLPSSQTNRLQLILNAAARAVTKTPKLHHISPTLKSLHWLKINQRIQYKILSLTHKTLHSGRPSYLRSLLNLKQSRFTRSSSLITLARPSNPSRLKITSRSFYHAAPALWNSLPANLRQISPNCSASTSPFLLSPSVFYKKLKAHLFRWSFPP